MRGDATLFARAGEVEAAWNVVMPALDALDADAVTVAEYDPGSSGPTEADRLIIPDGRAWDPLT